MPWTAADASRYTKKANTAKIKKRWAQVANSVLEKTGDEGKAIREANSVAGVMYHQRNNPRFI